MFILIGTVVSIILNVLPTHFESMFIDWLTCRRMERYTQGFCDGNPEHCEHECMMLAMQGEEELQDIANDMVAWRLIIHKGMSVVITALCIAITYLIML